MYVFGGTLEACICGLYVIRRGIKPDLMDLGVGGEMFDETFAV